MRAEGFADVLARRRFLATRLVLRTLLAERLGVEPEAVPLAMNADGRPVPGVPGPVFSIAHSGEMALCALAEEGERLGVDLERLRPVPRALALAREVLGETVGRELEALSPSHRSSAFLAAWTRHEALVKAAGGSLARVLAGPKAFRVGAGDLTCHALPLPAGYVGTVASTSPVPPELRDFLPAWLAGRAPAQPVAFTLPAGLPWSRPEVGR